jgi:hypothetical protein
MNTEYMEYLILKATYLGEKECLYVGVIIEYWYGNL